jgi:hypothetical protein
VGFCLGIEDLDLYSVCVVVVVVMFFPLLLARETACKREKKALFIPRMMNSNSLSWASYCSSASDFLPIEESGAACFAELLLKFCCFQPNIEADRNALRGKINNIYYDAVFLFGLDFRST